MIAHSVTIGAGSFDIALQREPRLPVNACSRFSRERWLSLRLPRTSISFAYAEANLARSLGFSTNFQSVFFESFVSPFALLASEAQGLQIYADSLTLVKLFLCCETFPASCLTFSPPSIPAASIFKGLQTYVGDPTRIKR